jgi:hypothetical protein
LYSRSMSFVESSGHPAGAAGVSRAPI